MLSIIIKEHEETSDKIGGMITQAANIPLDKELIFATSKLNDSFLNQYNIYQYDFPIRAITGTKNAGNGVYLGSLAAKGDNLLILDCHMCTPGADTLRLINTLEQNPNCVITPAINDVEFPSCSVRPAEYGYGVKFKMSSKNPLEWLWLPKLYDYPYPVPLSCGGAVAMKKHVFNDLYNHGGIEAAFDFEEEKSMRLWRLGHPTLMEPNAKFGHWFKQHMAKTMAENWYKMRIAALYINTLDDNRWNMVQHTLTKAWNKSFTDNIEWVYKNYSSLREEMMDYRYSTDESYFLEIQD